MAGSYDDEIDLYGDVTEATSPGGGRPSNSNGRGDDYGSGVSSIPTFISEARGGTGVIPMRDEYSRGGRPGDGGPGGSGPGPAPQSQGQWQNNNRQGGNDRGPSNTDGPEEGQV